MSDEAWSARRTSLFLLSAFIAEAAVRLWFVHSDHFPRVFWDEPSYLAYAEYFAGIRSFDLTGAPAVEWGYGLLLSPLFLLHAPFPVTYKLVLIVNCFLLASVPFALYAIGRQAFGLSRKLAFGLALGTSCYPPLLLFATFSMTENLYIPLFLVTCFALVRVLQQPTLLRMGAFSSLTVALYAVHVWGITVVFVGAIVLTFLGASRVARWGYVGAALAIQALLTVGVASVNASLQREFHTTLVPGVAALLSVGLSPAHLGLLLKMIVSEFFATNLATACMLGLTLAFGFAILVKGWRKRASDLARVDTGLLIFIVLCIGAILIACPIALTAMLPKVEAPEKFLDCRYVDGEVAPAIFFALLLIVRRRALGANLVDRCFLISILVLGLSWLASRDVIHMQHWESNGDYVFGVALLGMLRLFGFYSIGLLSATILGAVLLLFLGYRRWPAAAVTALATLYLASAVAAETREYLPDFRQLDARIGSRNAGRLVTLLQTLPRGTTIPDELKEGTYVFFAFYQLSLPNLTIHYFDPDAAPPSDTYALVRASWPGSTYGYSNVGCETMTNTCLWTSSLEAARSLTTILRSTDPWSGGIRLSQISGIDFGSLDQPWATTRGVLFPEVADGLTWRWTDGDAEYRLDAILSGRPSELSVSLFLPVPEKIRITVGAVQLFSRALPTGLFKQTFPLRQRNFTRATTIGIASVPVSANVPKPFDTLGVQVRSLRIR